MTPEVFFAPGTDARTQLLQLLGMLPLIRRTATIIPVRRQNPYEVQVVRNTKSPGWLFAGGGLKLSEPDGVGCLREWDEELPLSYPFRIADSFRPFASLHILPSPDETFAKRASAFFEGMPMPDWLTALLGETKLPLTVGLDAIFTATMNDETPIGIRESDEAEVTAWKDVRHTDPAEFGYFHGDIALAWRQHVESRFTRYPDPLVGYNRLGGKRVRPK